MKMPRNLFALIANALILVAILLIAKSPAANVDQVDGVIVNTLGTSSNRDMIKAATASYEVTPELPPPMTEVPQTPMIVPTVNPFSALYDCEMEIEFLSDPLASRGTQFTVLGRDYFLDKGDKFAMGKGTGILYKDQRYFIIHSGYLKENIRSPLEVEFIRRYLEGWGNTNNEFIQQQIASLLGAEVAWVCDGSVILRSVINGVVRLSHEASEHLWLQPHDIEIILSEREGDPTEWIGELEKLDNQHLYLGFCGWGPESLGRDRYTYYRYVIRFDYSFNFRNDEPY